jgi:DNA topoisomerase-1
MTMKAKFQAILERLSGDPLESARAVGLRYISDATAGFRRKKAGKNFKYLDASDKMISDTAILNRIKALAIPPAWSAVWICPFENGHLQASGRDARGRKQYRYHRRWREVRDETKYSHAIAFARALPRIRRRVARDLRRRGLPREKVLATVVRLLEVSLIRVGNDEYAQSNNSFGLTTMQDRHVRISGGRMLFQFRGKGGKLHCVDIEDRRLAKIVRNCQSIPGQELFQYIDNDGQAQDIGSIDVNDYLREISGGDFTAKDFRTWAGTVLAAMALGEFEKFDSPAQARRNIVQAIEKVASRLGNTPVVCRKSYIHPAVLDAYLDGSMLKTLQKRAEAELIHSLHALQPEEASVLTLLQQKLTQAKRGGDLKKKLVQSLKHAQLRSR